VPQLTGACITFVGNEGVVVSTPSGTVAIDALFGHGAANYADVPDAVLDAIEAARSPFDAIDLFLATHYHPDHFNPRALTRHLRSNTRSRFLSTPQAVRLLGGDGNEPLGIENRIHATRPPEGERETTELCGFRVDAFGLSHGRVNFGDVEHNGYVVRIGGLSILHLGDGIIDEKALDGAGVLSEPVDIAFLPFWFLTYPYGQRLMSTKLRPRHTFAVHIPPSEQSRIEAEIADFAPRVVALTRSMSRHEIGKGMCL